MERKKPNKNVKNTKKLLKLELKLKWKYKNKNEIQLLLKTIIVCEWY